MKFDLPPNKLFWGLCLLFAGAQLLFEALGIKLPIFRVFLAFFLIYWGLVVLGIDVMPHRY